MRFELHWESFFTGRSAKESLNSFAAQLLICHNINQLAHIIFCHDADIRTFIQKRLDDKCIIIIYKEANSAGTFESNRHCSGDGLPNPVENRVWHIVEVNVTLRNSEDIQSAIRIAGRMQDIEFAE